MQFPEIVNAFIMFLEKEGTSDFLDNILKVMAIITTLYGIIPYIVGLASKHHDVDFSYLARLRVDLQYIRRILNDYKIDIVDSILVKDGREIDADRVERVHQMRDDLAERSKDVITYLKETKEQYPAGRGWSECLTNLIDLLYVCERISTDNHGYALWTDSVGEALKEDYIDDCLINLDNMIALIKKRQKKIEKKLFFPWEKIKR